MSRPGLWTCEKVELAVNEDAQETQKNKVLLVFIMKMDTVV